jgi:DNA-binding transcriptional regulator YiaG
MHYAICGLDYVYLEDIPVARTKHGDVIGVDLSIIERDIARELILQGIPLRGAEVHFLRKVLGASMDRFAKMLGLSAPSILKWERDRTRRLAPVNEVAVRALMAEQLDVDVQGTFTILKGKPETPARLMLPIHI